jgi:hypothetical protein
MARRKGKPSAHQQARSAPPSPVAHAPAVQTLFRFKIYDIQTRTLIQQTTTAILPALQQRDGPRIALIQAADSAATVLDTLPLATGIAETFWDRQMRRFGDEALPLMAQRLCTAAAIQDQTIRGLVYEKLVANLRWRGERGATVLLEVFATLDDYGRSLACVALGRMGVESSVDLLWEFYQRVAGNQRETYLVGPLWGLVDLGDARVGDALDSLLIEGHIFTELFGFLYQRGTVQAVLPLMQLLTQQPKRDYYKPLLALVGIAHRIGREALVATIATATLDDPSSAERMADAFLSRPAEEAEAYFREMFRGPSPADFAKSLAALASR